MRRLLTGAFLAALIWPVQAFAGDGKTEAVKPAGEDHPLKELWSGYRYAAPAIRAMQDKDDDNPAMKLYGEGEKLWNKVGGQAKKSCASCHGEAAKSMKGAATRFPAIFKLTGKPLTIEARINLCREKFMQAPRLTADSEPLLALAIYVNRQSKDMTLSVAGDGPAEPFVKKGRDYYTARRGQLDISCAGCHEKYAGKRYRAEKLSQGHANGFPAYRQSLKQTVSLPQQVNRCLARMRANPLKAGSDEIANLELYLARRANGLVVETPAVRE